MRSGGPPAHLNQGQLAAEQRSCFFRLKKVPVTEESRKNNLSNLRVYVHVLTCSATHVARRLCDNALFLMTKKTFTPCVFIPGMNE